MKKVVVCQKCESINRVVLNRLDHQEPICGKCGQTLDVRSVRTISFKQLSSILKSSELPVVVDAFANWCGPCKAYGPIFQEVAATDFLKADFFKVDTEANQDFSAKYGIRGIPATLFFKGGGLAHNQPGLLSAPDLRRLLQTVG